MFCISVYSLEIIALCQDFNFDKIYALFGVNSFSPEIMVVYSLGHLEGLHAALEGIMNMNCSTI